MNLSEEATVPEAADFLNVRQETVRRNIRERRLPAIKRGTQWFIRRESLISFASGYDPRTGKQSELINDPPQEPPSFYTVFPSARAAFAFRERSANEQNEENSANTPE